MPTQVLDDTRSAPEAGSATPSRRRVRISWHTWGPILVFACLFGISAAVQPAFLRGGLGILAIQATPIILVALGQAMVLHVGSIDLSNAALAIFAAILLAKTLGPLGVAAPVVCLLVATAIGALNGALVSYAQVPSFALTLGTLGILEAAAQVVSGSGTVYVTDHADVLASLFGTAFVGLPAGFWVSVLLAAALWAVLRRTTWGLRLTAVGLNERGAMFSGLGTRRMRVAAYAASGLLAGVAGIMVVAQGGSASASGLGSDLLIPGIAAALVGGTAITGGVTNPLNVVVGALTIALIPIGASVMGITSEAQSLVYGLVIVVAVAVALVHDRSTVVK